MVEYKVSRSTRRLAVGNTLKITQKNFFLLPFITPAILNLG